MTDITDLLRERGGYYELRNIFTRITQAEGAHVALRRAYELHLAAFAAGIRPTLSDESAEALSRATAAMPRASLWRRACGAAAVHNFPQAMTDAIAAILTAEPLPAALDEVVAEGPDANFPVWHLINPFFHIWRALPADPGDTQAHWRRNAAVASDQGVPTEEGYEAWLGVPNRERAELLAWVKTAKPGCVLDIGCSNGMWLRWMIENWWDTTAFEGVEYHRNRADSAAILMQRAEQVRKDFSAAVSVHDLLSDAALPMTDLVTAIQVFGAFDDEQVSHILRKITACGASHIFDASVVNTYGGWRGRPDPAPLFESAGWRLVWRKMLGDPIYPAHAMSAVLPCKYWSQRSATLWERVT